MICKCRFFVIEEKDSYIIVHHLYYWIDTNLSFKQVIGQSKNPTIKQYTTLKTQKITDTLHNKQ